jgi:hypothetical protein
MVLLKSLRALCAGINYQYGTLRSVIHHVSSVPILYEAADDHYDVLEWYNVVRAR